MNKSRIFEKRYYNSFSAPLKNIVGLVWLLLEFVQIIWKCDEFDNFISADLQNVINGIRIRFLLIVVSELTMIIYLLMILVTLWNYHDTIKQFLLVFVLSIFVAVGVTYTNFRLCNPHYTIGERYDRTLSCEANMFLNVMSDIENNRTLTVSVSKAEIIDEEIASIMDYDGKSRDYLYLKCNDILFPIGNDDFDLLVNNYRFVDTSYSQNNKAAYFLPQNPNDNLLITYYAESKIIKKLVIQSGKEVEIVLEINENRTILVNRPDIDGYNKNLFWYVTKDGEFSECFQAYYKTWTNFLTFADEGNYTVTFVTDYDEDTGEYTPISNTIEYTIE